jgi:hypothetical protein
MTSLIIIITLIFIGSQLYKLRAMKSEENEEEKIHDLLPHIYKKSTSEQRKNQVKKFMADRKFPTWRHTEMIKVIEEQKDLEKKSSLEKLLGDNMAMMNVYINKFRDRRQINGDEIQYLVWSYLEQLHRDFPQPNFLMQDFDHFMTFSGYESEDVFPIKTNK